MIGLKLWSINTDYYLKAAKELYALGIFDYIELYYVPNTLDTLPKWQELEIPYTIHAPHFMHGVNLADKNKEEINRAVYKEVLTFTQALKGKYIIIHSGMDGTPEETIRQIKKFNIKNFIIENKPYLAPVDNSLLCRGASLEEIKYIIESLDCGFCFDIGHAICAYNSLRSSLNEDLYQYLAQFNVLNPLCYHISDNYVDSEIDRHLHFGHGTFDFTKLVKILDFNKDVSLETTKDSKTDLNDFREDVKFLTSKFKI